MDKRTFKIPKDWKEQNKLLHFGAFDWETIVYVIGEKIDMHEGRYDSFCFDIGHIIKSGIEQEILVFIWDPTSTGIQARGKQAAKPEGMWYAPVSGIWQTVWLDPVAK